MISRRGFLLTGCCGLLVAHQEGRGQAAATIRRVGMLSGVSETASAPVRMAFMQEMRGLGWLEGKNVEYRIVYADGDAGRLDALARELVRQKVDVVVVVNALTARAMQRATTAIPIVMTSVPDPVGNGFVASLAKPGGNITGITNQQEEVLGKLVGILHEIAPGGRRIAVLLNENNPSHVVYWGAAQSACSALNLVALRIVASAPAELEAATRQIVRQRSQAVVVVQDPVYFSERAKLQKLMAATRLPVAYGLREHVIAGGLLCYAVDLAANFRNAARYVDKILHGASPADLPVEQATAFRLVINLKTAESLGLTIPQSVRLRADEVIE